MGNTTSTTDEFVISEDEYNQKVISYRFLEAKCFMQMEINKQLLQEKAALQQKIEDILRLTMGNSSTRGVVISQDEYNQKEKSYRSLEASYDTQMQINKQLQQKKAAMRQKIKDIQSQKDTVEREKKIVETKLDEYNQKENSYRSLEASYDMQMQINKQLQQEKAAMQQKIKDIQSQKDTVEREKKIVETKLDEYNQKENSYRSLEASYDMQMQINKQLRQEKDAIQSQKDTVEREKKIVETKLDEYNQKENFYRSLEASYDMQMQINKQLRQEKDAIQSQKDTVEREKKIVETKVDEYNQKENFYRSLEASYDMQMRINKQLRQEKDAIQSQKDTAERETKIVETKLLEYDSLPICKSLLNMNQQLADLESDTRIHLNTDSSPSSQLLEDVNKIRRSVDELKRTTKGHSLFELAQMRTEELEQLERDLDDPQNNHSNYAQVRNLNEMLKELEEQKLRIANSIQKTLEAAEKEITIKRATLNDIKSNHVDVLYGQIKNILVEQENILLKYSLYISTTGKNDDQKSFKNNDDQKSLRNNEDARKYNLILCNIPEEFVDQDRDYATVLEILNCISRVTITDVKVTRLGRVLVGKTRIIKATFPNTDLVDNILRYKYKLKSGPYSTVRIFPDRPSPKATNVANKIENNLT